MGLWRRRQRRPALSRDAALACRPVKNRDIRVERLDSGEILLVYPVKLKPWMSELLRRFNRTPLPEQMRKLQLDELGSATWDLIDDERTVEQIVDAFAAAYRLHPKEAELSVTRFLLELGKRGLIAMQ